MRRAAKDMICAWFFLRIDLYVEVREKAISHVGKFGVYWLTSNALSCKAPTLTAQNVMQDAAIEAESHEDAKFRSTEYGKGSVSF